MKRPGKRIDTRHTKTGPGSRVNIGLPRSTSKNRMLIASQPELGGQLFGTSSTRRFFAWPSSLVLVATGHNINNPKRFISSPWRIGQFLSQPAASSAK